MFPCLFKLEFWSEIKAAEVWIWEDKKLHAFVLTGKGYQPVSRSKVLPGTPHFVSLGLAGWWRRRAGEKAQCARDFFGRAHAGAPALLPLPLTVLPGVASDRRRARFLPCAPASEAGVAAASALRSASAPRAVIV
jgi:hypothetical protein